MTVLRKSSVCTLTDICKSWIWWTLEHIRDIFRIWHFYNASMLSLGRNNFWTSCMNQFFRPKNFWSLMKVPCPKNMSQGQSTNWGFFQKRLTTFQKLFSIWVPIACKAKLEGARFSMYIHNCKKAVYLGEVKSVVRSNVFTASYSRVPNRRQHTAQNGL